MEEEVALSPNYGTEISWPMQRGAEEASVPYRDFLQGCYEMYTAERCDESEADRITINANQPAVQRNFTAAGYAKVQAPRASYNALRQFWDLNHAGSTLREVWEEASVYTNHWESPTQTLLIDAADGPRMSLQSRRQLVDRVQTVLEQWTGVPLQPTSMFGIRSYANGSILAPHLDR